MKQPLTEIERRSNLARMRANALSFRATVHPKRSIYDATDHPFGTEWNARIRDGMFWLKRALEDRRDARGV
jgi:hypothetical protein